MGDGNIGKGHIGTWCRAGFERYLAWRYGAIDSTAPLGRRGEQAAARALRRRGWKILAHSESDRLGELDLIALDGRTLVFVEVKTLASRRPGHPAERVDADKQRRITQAALRYLKRHRLLEQRARFDVVAIWWPETAPRPVRLELYENAFAAQGEGQWFC